MLHKELFIANRNDLRLPRSASSELLDFEKRWIEKGIDYTWDGYYPHDLSSLKQAMSTLIERDRQDDPDSSKIVANNMTFDQFKILVQEFAMDGLTEAQIFWSIMPRLSLDAQMPMLRMMIDEFGSGNISRSHTNLYKKLLDEMEMPKNLDYYIDVNGEDSFAFVNMYYWMILRADDPSYFIGALTYFESMIPFFFDCYIKLCERLKINNHEYYSEHIHIDEYHAIEGQRILKAMNKDGSLDPLKAWQGALFGRSMTLNAFDSAVEKACLY